LPAAAVILAGRVRDGKRSPKQGIIRLIVPVIAISILAGLWMVYYNFKVTGLPWKMPYQVYENHYPSTPIFLWSTKPQARDLSVPRIFLDLQQTFLQKQHTLQTLNGYVKEKTNDLLNVLFFYFRFVLLIPLVTLPLVFRNRWNALAGLIVGLVFVTAFLETQSYPRKLAPAAGLLVLLAVQSLRHLRFYRFRGRPVGSAFTALLAVVLGCSVAVSFLPFFHAAPWPVSQQRAELENRLNKEPGRHLILVKLGSGSYAYPHFAWVYNRADIDAAKVIWARDLGWEQNQKLCQYYQGRDIWLLESGEAITGREGLKPYR
jgi:hypothetical protein